MPRILYLDCTRGITPEAVAGGLVDLGVPPSPLIAAVAPLSDLAELRFDREPDGTRTLIVAGPEPAPLLTLADAVTRLTRGGLTPEATVLAIRILHRMAEACDDAGADFGIVEDAAPDSLLGIAAAAAALAEVAPDRVVASQVEVGTDKLPRPLITLLAEASPNLRFELDPDLPTSLGGAALLDVIAAPEDWGQPEPVWPGFVARGRGLKASGDPGFLPLSLGDGV